MTSHDQATLEIIHEDDRMRVSRWTFQTGQATGEHIHEMDYVAVPISGGAFRAEMGDGSIVEMTQVAGQPYARAKGVHHNVVFVGQGVAQFVEIELKD